ncbi:hypothetical protein ABZ208_33105 [Streptomyces sp. NPDC006208]|uniref:WD40 repeat domain-containing protein n=1 Tax=Streptomyces sp. NPDC006208 TaxID=3156734 RepID=UPI0033A0D211
MWDIREHRRLAVDWPGSAERDLCTDSTWAFTPDGRGIYYPAESGIRSWDVRTGRERHPISVPSAWEVTFSDDGMYVATASQSAVQLWRTADLSAPVLNQPVTGVGLSNLRLDLAVGVLRYQEGSDPAAVLRTLSLDGVVPRQWQQQPYVAARFAPDGAMLATVTGRRIQIRDGGSGELRSTLPESVCEDCPPLVSFSADGRAFAHLTGRDRETATATVRRLNSWGRAATVGKGVNGIVFRPDGRSMVLTQSVTETDRWTLDGESRTAVRRAPDGDALAMSPDGHVLTTDRQLIHVASGRSRRVMTAESLAVTAVFSADGRFLAMGDMDGRVTLWDGKGQRRLAVLVGGSSNGGDLHRPPPALAFSADGTTVAVGGADGSLRLWQTGAPAGPSAPLTSVDGPVLAVAFAEHDTRLRITTRHVTVHSYGLEPRRTAVAVCRRTGSGLSRAAWERYLPAVPYRATR